jgi:hypothetical protein
LGAGRGHAVEVAVDVSGFAMSHDEVALELALLRRDAPTWAPDVVTLLRGLTMCCGVAASHDEVALELALLRAEAPTWGRTWSRGREG